MEGAFTWLTQIIEALGRFIPRLVIIRATHAGVKWKCGSQVKAMAPGLHFYWPLTTEVEVMVTARQTLAIPDQVLATKDGKKIVVKTLVVYRIGDIVKAIGKQNWDVDVTVTDLTQAVVVRVIANHTWAEILAGVGDETFNKTLTHAVRRELRQFGVSVARCRIVDFAECKVFKLLTSTPEHAGIAHAHFYT
jgi:regulator of protease activity HflC (stomatin/prohibitin superfamily)